ncbi:MAG: superoxide dismutase family protein [Pseudomonadota bacterium]|nr:superoxide dismutase family protein [Pseudomonadota bacterium]
MTRILSITTAACATVALFACSQQPSDAQDQEMSETLPTETASESLPYMMRATGDLIGSEGDTIGSINLLEGPNGILMEVAVDEGGLPPGWHGIHIHQVGDCSDTGVFKASGGHLGKIEGGHGLLNSKGPEAGDLANLYAFDDGSVKFETFTNLTTLSDLLDEDGSAIIVHEGRDDHMSQPIGGAGGRIACAVIE